MKAIKVIMIIVVMAVVGFGLMTHGYVLGHRSACSKIATMASTDINDAGMAALKNSDTGETVLIKFLEVGRE